jgi:hypothetical protein
MAEVALLLGLLQQGREVLLLLHNVLLLMPHYLIFAVAVVVEAGRMELLLLPEVLLLYIGVVLPVGQVELVLGPRSVLFLVLVAVAAVGYA